MPDPRVLPSPNGVHLARFTWAGEIRFGPEYFHLDINGRMIDNSAFGNNALWSQDDRFLAVQEWLNTVEREGPTTTLTVIDVEQLTKCSTPPFAGFCEPRIWSGRSIEYKEVTYDLDGEHTTTEKLEIGPGTKWEPVPLRTTGSPR